MSRPNVLPVGKGHDPSQTDSSPKRPRPKVLSAGKGLVASKNESRPSTMIELFRTLNPKLEEMNRLLDRKGKKIEDMAK